MAASLTGTGRASEGAQQLHEPFLEIQVDHVVQGGADRGEIRRHFGLPIAHDPCLRAAVGAPATRSRLIPFLKRSIGTSVMRRPLSMTPIQSQMRSSSWTK